MSDLGRAFADELLDNSDFLESEALTNAVECIMENKVERLVQSAIADEDFEQYAEDAAISYESEIEELRDKNTNLEDSLGRLRCDHENLMAQTFKQLEKLEREIASLEVYKGYFHQWLFHIHENLSRLPIIGGWFTIPKIPRSR